MGSVREGFAALAALADDDVLRQRITKKAEALLASKRPAPDVARAYLEIEEELARRPGAPSADDIRSRVKAAFAGAEKELPGFELLFLPEERQFNALANRLVSAYAAACRRFLGGAVIERLIRNAVLGTRWKDMEVTVEKGIPYNPLRMRNVKESAEMVMAVLDGWHRGTRVLVGEAVGRELFEDAYRALSEECRFLPARERLLGATPVEMLTREKAERIHDLESRTTTQERGLRAADEDLRRQAERLRRTVEELEETKRVLEATSKARSEFIDVVAHQFRTPLSSIRWNAELLTDALGEKQVDEEYREAVEMMRAKSVYLIDTLDRVFMTLDIDTGTLVLDRKPAFLWELVQNVHDEYAKEFERKGAAWSFKKTKEQVREVLLDKAKMTTVLRIILGNALMYGKEGGKIAVDLRPERIEKKDYLTCTVKDDGLGLDEEAKAQFFEKFFRSKDSKLVAPDGTGLGNYVVKNVVEAHGGKVWVESAGKGKGTSVAFALPLET